MQPGDASGWTGGMSPARAATIESVGRLEQAIRSRAETDRPFLSWWIYFLLLSWITFGIAGIYYFYRRIARIDEYSRRKMAYYNALVEFTQQHAGATSASAAIRPLIEGMHVRVSKASRTSLKPIGAGLTLFLTIITLGLWGIVALYQVNRAWDDRQRFEASFVADLSQTWMQMGLLTHPITFRIDEGKRRNFWIWLLLSIVTFGIGSLVWDYRLHTDPDRLYPEFHVVEDAFLQIARTA